MILELTFPVYGDAPLPADHGYLLYSALIERVPQLQGAADIAVHPLTGRYVGDRLLILMPFSELALRLPDTRISEFLPLARGSLCLGAQSIRLGIPQVDQLHAADTLRGRIVAFEHCQTGTPFTIELHRRLDAMGVASQVTCTLLNRRSLTTDRTQLTGFDIRLSGLTDTESLIVQENRAPHPSFGFDCRHLGCGVFKPDRIVGGQL